LNRKHGFLTSANGGEVLENKESTVPESEMTSKASTNAKWTIKSKMPERIMRHIAWKSIQVECNRTIWVKF